MKMYKMSKGTKGLTKAQSGFARGLAGMVSKTVNPLNKGYKKK